MSAMYALKAFTKNNSVIKWDYYKSLRNMATTVIKSEKKSYIQYRIKQMGSTKNLWTFLRNMGLWKERRQSHNYFINAIPESRINITTFDLFFSTKLNNKFYFTPVDEDTVYKIFFSISPACGLDGLNINFIINFCFETGHFPACWKQSLVLYLQKKSNPEGCAKLQCKYL